MRICPQFGTGHLVSFCLCPRCERPVSIILAPTIGSERTLEWLLNVDETRIHDVALVSGWRIKETFPAPVTRSVPEHTPDDVAKLYRAARSAIARHEIEAAAFLLRRVVERLLLILDGGAAGTLSDRLAALAQAGRLSAILLPWAQELTVIVGGDADLATARDADVAAANEFVEMFLLNAFTTIGQFETRLSRAAAAPDLQPAE
jgi:hypothetical protein